MKLAALFLVAVSLLGQSWPITIDSGSATDANYSGGSTTTVNTPAGVDPTARYGNFSYQLPVDSVPYVVTFNFLEQTVGGPGQRQFQVKINDQVIFDHLDLFVSCGFMVPCSRSVIVKPSMNVINISFTTQTRSSIVSSISYTPLFALLSTGNGAITWVAGTKACSLPNPGAPTSDCVGMFLLAVQQFDGTIKNYVATPAAAEAVAGSVWK